MVIGVGGQITYPTGNEDSLSDNEDSQEISCDALACSISELELT